MDKSPCLDVYSRSGLERWIIDVKSPIGRGGQAAVFPCSSAKHNSGAMKLFMSSQKMSQRSLTVSFYKEMASLERLSHPNIPKLLGHISSPSGAIHALVMQRVGQSDLCTFLNKSKDPIPIDQVRNLFRQLVSAVAHCHQSGVIHRDIKLDNVLVDETRNQVWLIDFGLSKFDPQDTFITDSYPGSHLYASPELCKHEPYKGRKADVWALGVVLYCMLHKRMPFKDTSPPGISLKIINTEPCLDPTLDPMLAELILTLLTKDQFTRPDINYVLSHPWIQ